jgi:hypothetical protein
MRVFKNDMDELILRKPTHVSQNVSFYEPAPHYGAYLSEIIAGLALFFEKVEPD